MYPAGYDDGTIRRDDHGITIRHHCPWRTTDTAFVLEVGRRVCPTITPDDTAAVVRMNTERGQG